MRNGGEIKKLNWTVDAAAGKMKLGDHLADNLDALSRMYLRSLIRDGMVEVNGRHENAGYRVRGGDFVEVEADMSRGTSMVAEDIPLDIVFEDDEIVVVNKPAGMLVHPSHREKTGTLLNALSIPTERGRPRPPWGRGTLPSENVEHREADGASATQGGRGRPRSGLGRVSSIASTRRRQD